MYKSKWQKGRYFWTYPRQVNIWIWDETLWCFDVLSGYSHAAIIVIRPSHCKYHWYLLPRAINMSPCILEIDVNFVSDYTEGSIIVIREMLALRGPDGDWGSRWHRHSPGQDSSHSADQIWVTRSREEESCSEWRGWRIGKNINQTRARSNPHISLVSMSVLTQNSKKKFHPQKILIWWHA